MTSSGLVVPIVLWGKFAPTHCISALLVTSDQKNIITGCHDGQIVLWDLTEDVQIVPRSMLFGHSASITCLARANESWDSATFISSAENGEMCLWDVGDGRCIEQNKLPGVHLSMQPYQVTRGTSREWRIICQGYYPDIHILDATSLELIYTLSSRVAPDWISAFCVVRPLKRSDDVVIGVTTAGMLKVWSLISIPGKETEAKYEEECKQLRCHGAKTVTCCTFTLRTVLVVCAKKWQIYDAGDFSQLCAEPSEKGQRWIGGEFTAADRVLIWSSKGKGYLYQLPSNCIPDSDDFRSHVGRNPDVGVRPFLYCVLETRQDAPLSCTPVMTFFYGRRGPFYKLFIRGDSSGQLTIWKIPEVTEKELSFLKQEEFDTLPVLPPTSQNSLEETWERCCPGPAGIIDQLCNNSKSDSGERLQVTASIYIAGEGWLVSGRNDGSILIAPAVQSAIAQLLEGPHTARIGWPPHRILRGHHGRVTCLLYPHQENTRYDPHHLVSGGVDFTVCLWNLFAGYKLHSFCVHGGELTQLLVPPENCNARVLTCICSVASDHSVALLSLRDRKCVLLASRHLFPIRAIKWRPAEDFLIVALDDGSVFVWQMETGHLDRIAEGTTAEDILEACTEESKNTEMMLTPAQSIAQAFRRRSLAAIKNAAHRTLLAAAQGSVLNIPTTSDQISKDPSHALTIQAMKTNLKDPDFHVLFFDAEVLIIQLLTDTNLIPGIVSRGSNPDLAKLAELTKESKTAKLTQKMAGFITKQIQQMKDSDEEQEDYSHSQSSANQEEDTLNAAKKGHKGLTLETSHLTLDIAQLFMSCLHAWDLDPSLDEICLNKLGLLKPHNAVSFGLISHGAHMSLMLPGWNSRIPSASTTPTKSPSSNTTQLSAKEALEIKKGTTSPSDSSLQASPTDLARLYVGHWELSRAVTTQHLLSVISVANTLMGMNNASFVMLSHFRKARPKRVKGKRQAAEEQDEDDDDLSDLTPEQALIKQGWSLLAALHCVLLPDLLGSMSYKPPYLEMLARRWQDRCLEVRSAAQALLLAELRRIGGEGREDVIHQWAPHLPYYVDSSLSLTGANTPGSSVGLGVRDQLETSGSDTPDVDHEEEILSGDSPVRKVSVSFESRRKQATAIVMLGVIGAEFGAEIQPSRKYAPSNLSNRPIQQGFGLSDYSLARHTAQALSFLLLQPPSSRLPSHTPIRRAGIDLLGRGFTVWEPFIDVSAVLIGLLELSCDPALYAASMTCGLPVTPAADSCRSAHHALSLIATARPATFITTMAREVARHQAQANQSQTPIVNIQITTLYKAKAEILRIVELLIDKMQNDVVDLMLEVADIVIFCLDSNRLKTRGLMDVFPAICRFNMISYCHSSKKIAVGAKTGAIAIYDLKAAKSQVEIISGHSTAVTALNFSPDGKYLASYAFGDVKLCFWQTGSSLLGGMISSATKCIKAYKTKPCSGMSTANQLRQVQLSWPTAKAAILRNVDGSLDKFVV